MSKIHCTDCGSARDAREMQGCRGCGAYVCVQCATRQSNLCAECAGQDERLVLE